MRPKLNTAPSFCGSNAGGTRLAAATTEAKYALTACRPASGMYDSALITTFVQAFFKAALSNIGLWSSHHVNCSSSSIDVAGSFFDSAGLGATWNGASPSLKLIRVEPGCAMMEWLPEYVTLFVGLCGCVLTD